MSLFKKKKGEKNATDTFHVSSLTDKEFIDRIQTIIALRNTKEISYEKCRRFIVKEVERHG